MPTDSRLDALYWFVLFEQKNCSFTECGRALGVSQSRVSQRIAELEAKYSQELVIRGGRNNSLTPAGKVLLQYAQKAMASVSEGEAAVAKLASASTASETLRIGYSPSAVGMVASALAVIRNRPGLTVFTEEIHATVLEERLLGQSKRTASRLDLGLAYVKQVRAGLSHQPVTEIPLALIMSPRHPLAARSEAISAAELKEVRLALPTKKRRVRQTIDRYFGKRQPQNVVLEADAVATLLAAARVGFAATILPGISADGFAVRPLLRAPKQTTSLLWNADVELSEVARAFAAAVRDISRGP